MMEAVNRARPVLAKRGSTYQDVFAALNDGKLK